MNKFKSWNMNKNEINFIINTNHRITRGFFESITKQIYFELNTFFSENIAVNMFRKFDEKESVSGVTQLKSSIQKGIRNKILELYPR